MSQPEPLDAAARNLHLARIGLDLGILSERMVKNAFLIWICDNKQGIDQILVEMKAISAAQQKALLDAHQKWTKENRTATPSDILGLRNILEFLDDSKLEQSILSIQTEALPPTPMPSPSSATVKSWPQSSGSREEGPENQTDFRLGDRFLRRQILSTQGGMGEIWIALDRELNREVVVKYIREERAKDPQYQGMFHLEGEVTGFLEHPNIPPVYGLGIDTERRSYLAMRYFPGKKLTRAISEYHGMPKGEPGARIEAFRDLLHCFVSACMAVEYAHQKGVIHCDLKPDNIMLGQFGETVVLDWGLVVVTQPTGNPNIDASTESGLSFSARGYSPSPTAEEGLHAKQGGSRNYVGGTLAYMSPEQMKGTETGNINLITPACDIYCLGATLYHICTGRAPLVPHKKQDEKRDSYLERIKSAQFPKPTLIRQEVPRGLEAIILKAMALDPQKRYESAKSLATDVKHWLADEPVSALPEGFLQRGARWVRRHASQVSVGVVVFFLCLSLGFFLILNEQRKTLANLEKARNMGGALMTLLSDSETAYASPSLTPKRKQVYQETADAFSQFVVTYPDNQELLGIFADVSRYLGVAERFENRQKVAVEHFQKSQKALEKLNTLDAKLNPKGPTTPGTDIADHPRNNWKIKRAATLRDLAGSLELLGQFPEARESLDQSLTLLNELKTTYPDSQWVKREWALTKFGLAGIDLYQDKPMEAQRSGKEALETFEELIKNHKGTSPQAFDLLHRLMTKSRLGSALHAMGRFNEALTLHEEATSETRVLMGYLTGSVLQTLIGATREDIQVQTYDCLSARLKTWEALKRPPQEIERLHKVIIAGWTGLLSSAPDQPHFQAGLATALSAYGLWLKTTRPTEAPAQFAAAEKYLEPLVSKFPEIPAYAQVYGEILEAWLPLAGNPAEVQKLKEKQASLKKGESKGN